MTSHSLLIMAFAMSCFALSSCNVGDMASLPITYAARVLDASQEVCPPDDQRQISRAEVGQDLRRILQSYLGKNSERVCVQLL